MDFSVSGIMSAAKQAYDDGTPVEDVCFSLQEHIFGMLTEVSERALSLTGSDELVLGGGVAHNARLREMLETMCDQRGAEFFAPGPRFLGDNAGMIAVLGAKMYEAGDAIAIEDSAIDPNFRPDQVPVTWRDADEDVAVAPGGDETVRGAEALVEFEGDRVVKRRVPKAYRHPDLDATLRRDRTVLEGRLTSQARRVGVPTPVVYDLDPETATLVFERVGEVDLRDRLSEVAVRDVGRHLATIHEAGFVHGDPTTRNVRVGGDDRTYLIDFGLGYHTDNVEDYAMDLHVFDQSLVGTADAPEELRDAVRDGYRVRGDDAVLTRLRDVEGRGRYR
jgi:N6-L-threonylcarbamoyladenine synthase/protein kinase Bud32